MREPGIKVGSFWYWLLFRCLSFVTTMVGLIVAAANLHPLRLELFCMGTLLTIIALVGSHDLIYGAADEEGFHYRRYLSLRHLGWEEIVIISWTNANIVHLHLKIGGSGRRTLTAQSVTSKSWVQVFSEEPEIVRWLTLTKPVDADGIELRAPTASMPALFRRSPLDSRRIFQFVFVLIVTIWIFSVIYARH